MDELNKLVADIDGMGIPEPTGLKINALSTTAIIALHTGKYTEAEKALQRRTALMMEEADRVETDAFRRGQLSNVALFAGWLAARKGDFATATARAKEAMQHLEPDQNPRKNEPAHELMGFISLKQSKAQDAMAHLEQGHAGQHLHDVPSRSSLRGCRQHREGARAVHQGGQLQLQQRLFRSGPKGCDEEDRLTGRWG